MKECSEGWTKLSLFRLPSPLGEWAACLATSESLCRECQPMASKLLPTHDLGSEYGWTHMAVMTDSGFLGFVPADNSLGTPAEPSSGNP